MWNHINANTGAQYVCLSTDEKHTDVPNGSVLIEMNTSTFYLFDEEKSVWEPQVFGGGGGGGSIQADWNQNDETQPDYVKNRFGGYDEVINEVFLEGKDYQFSLNEQIRLYTYKVGLPVEPGMELLTLWNGKTYKNTVVDTPVGAVFGNLSIANLGEDTKEPFIYFQGIGFIEASKNELNYIQVSNAKGEYLPIKIPDKYLPTAVGKNTGLNAEIFNDYESNKAINNYSHAEGSSTTASGDNSHAEGYYTTASGDNSHAEGYYTTASGDNSHAEGRFNIIDSTGRYANIVGNGVYNSRSNAHTLDWQGNSWYQGSVLVAGKDMDTPDAELHPDSVIIKSSTPGSAKRFKITVTDDGAIKATEVQ